MPRIFPGATIKHNLTLGIISPLPIAGGTSKYCRTAATPNTLLPPPTSCCGLNLYLAAVASASISTFPTERMSAYSLPRRMWRLEPWGYPARSQFAITHLKFPAGSSNKGCYQYRRHVAVAYRLFLALYWTFWILYSSLGGDGPPTWWWCVYVTDWSAALMGGYFWAAFLAMIFSRTRFLDTAAWFLHDIACPLSLMVAILYWGMGSDAPVNGVSVHFHGVNALLMVIDLALSRYPYHLKHFLPATGFIAAYLLFNGLFWHHTGTVIYAPLNYSMMPLALISIIGTFLVLLPSMHLLCWRWELACFAYSEKRRNLWARKTRGEDPVPSLYNGHSIQQKRGGEQQKTNAEEKEERRGKSEGGTDDLQRSTSHDLEEGEKEGVVVPPSTLSDRVLATRHLPSLEDYDEKGKEGISEEACGGPRGGVVIGDKEDARYVTAAAGGSTATAPVAVAVDRLKG